MPAGEFEEDPAERCNAGGKDEDPAGFDGHREEKNQQ
ncbi:hypothetical protein EMGBS8_01490 [Verrucomicrobiota bacterium]|nr:hypothetical protein EMGBS8_01490 [Verrucomicrobiota bacterium]